MRNSCAKKALLPLLRVLRSRGEAATCDWWSGGGRTEHAHWVEGERHPAATGGSATYFVSQCIAEVMQTEFIKEKLKLNSRPTTLFVIKYIYENSRFFVNPHYVKDVTDCTGLIIKCIFFIT